MGSSENAVVGVFSFLADDILPESIVVGISARLITQLGATTTDLFMCGSGAMIFVMVRGLDPCGGHQAGFCDVEKMPCSSIF